MSHQLDYASPIKSYRKISGQFSLGKYKWIGSVIASPDAIYLIKSRREHRGAVSVGGAVGGAIGAVVAGAIARATSSPETYQHCTFGELPPEMTSHPDWPVKKCKPTVGVIIVKKEEIESIIHPRFSNLIKFETEDAFYNVQYVVFTGKKTFEFFNHFKWPMQWAGRRYHLPVELSSGRR